MRINYIYNSTGKVEYVVIPIKLWDSLLNILPKQHFNFEESEAQRKNSFDPKAYFGCLAHLNLDIEQELKEMRSQWTRNF